MESNSQEINEVSLTEENNVSTEIFNNDISEIITPIIVSTKPVDFGLETNKAVNMLMGLAPILAERNLLIHSYNELIKLEITPENIQLFKELKKKVVTNRTQGVEKWHKAEKRFYLDGGRFVDSIYKKEVIVNENMEEKLDAAANTFINIEKKKLQDLIDSRVELIKEYIENPLVYNLGILDEDAFNNLANGLKLAHETKIQKEKEEAERKQKEEEMAKLREKRKEELLPYWHLLPEKNRVADFSLYPDSQWQEIMNKLKLNAQKEKAKIEEAKNAQLKIDKRMETINPFLQFIEDVKVIIDLSDEDFDLKIEDLQLILENKKEEERLLAEKVQKKKERLEDVKPYINFITQEIDSLLEMDEPDFLSVLEWAKSAFENEQSKIKQAKEEQIIKDLTQERTKIIMPFYNFLDDSEKEIILGELSDADFLKLLGKVNELDLKSKKAIEEKQKAFPSVGLFSTENTTIQNSNGEDSYLNSFKEIVEASKKLLLENKSGTQYSKIQILTSTFVEHAKKILNEIK